jgi:hypothetical protein
MGRCSNAMNAKITSTKHHQVDDTVKIATRLAGTAEIGAIHVAVGDRPTYDELRHYRDLADSHALTLSMTADSIVLRPRPSEPEIAEAAPALGIARLLPGIGITAVRRTRSGARWLHAHSAAWNLGFHGLSEGTR